MNWYSQHGEDSVVWELFKGGHPGFFMEIGALDGKRFSNTLSFQEIGWKGVCVEAHQEYIGDLVTNRESQNCIVLWGAVTNKDQTLIDFYANKRGALSTLNPKLEEEFKKYGEYFTGFEKQKVPGYTLNSILSACRHVGTVDLLSIDVDGTEEDVIDGLDWKQYSPRIAIIEMSPHNREKVESRMKRLGYILAMELEPNGIFCRDDVDAATIRAASPSTNLIHTEHPLDREETKI